MTMTSLPSDTTADAGTPFPPTATQESIWLADKLARPDGPAYNEPMAFRVTGQLHPVALTRALHAVVNRHESLRTAFVETIRGLRATVHPARADFVEVTDLRTVDSREARSRADALLAENYRRPFDLGAGLLLRVCVVVLADNEAIVGLTVHHLATDAWSNTILIDEIGRHYQSLVRSGHLAELSAPITTYADVARAVRRDIDDGVFARQIEHWRGILTEAPEPLRLPLDRPRPPLRTYSGGSCSVSMPAVELMALFARSRDACRCTDFTVLLAAYAVLLHRYTDQNPITVGTTLLNRVDDEVLDVVGCVVNTAALVLRLDEAMTFRDLLAHTADTLRAMLDNGTAPYPTVVDGLDAPDPSHNPVFQTMLTQVGRRPVLNLGPGTSCAIVPVHRAAAKFELLVTVSDNDDEFEFEAEFNTDLFDPATVQRLLSHYRVLLTRLGTNIDTPLSRVSFLPDDEQHLILDVWNDTGVEYPRSTVIDLVEHQVTLTPDAVAVEFDGETLTYAELNRHANRLARRLIDRQGAGSGVFVGVYLHRSLEMVVALLGIIKAGFAYVPIDPDHPADRVSFMLDDADMSLIVTREGDRAGLAHSAVDLVMVSVTEPGTEDDTDPARDLSPDSPIYMIYTSGSTGRPKGVVNRHASVFNRLYWMQSAFPLTAADRILQKTPYSFDVSVWEFFWPLMFGARIVTAIPGGHRDADYLKRVIRDRAVTTIHFVPSMLNVFLEEDDLAHFCGSLRRVFCSGEALPRPTVEKFSAVVPCRLHNLYGPTEAAIDVSHWPCTPDHPGAVVPIGRPIANTTLYVVDKHLQLQPIGVPGELCIGGIGLASGYHNRDDLTRNAFVTNIFAQDATERLYRTGDLARFLPDGQIQYLGRIDNQIKLRGFRIEPEEISAAMTALPNVHDAAVVLHDTAAGRMLVGYAVVAGKFDERTIRDGLRASLPDYMIPQVIMDVPALPVTANGKLDRRALPAPGARRAVPIVAPATPQETVLAEIWTELLGAERVSVDANFFGCGGDSIRSIRVAARLRELGHPIDVHDIFAHPTIRALARLMVTQGGGAPTAPAETALCLLDPADRQLLDPGVDDAWPLTALQSGMVYHTMLHDDSSIYHDVFDYDIAAEVRQDLLREAIRILTAHHPHLRSTFDLDRFSVPLQIVRTDAAVPLRITDLSQLPWADQDEVIAQWIEAEKRTAFVMGGGPLVRFHVHLRAPSRMNLTISFHHVLLDGWSVALLLAEFRAVYGHLLNGRPVERATAPPRYSTYVKLEHQASHDPAHAAFWRATMAGFTGCALPPSGAAAEWGTRGAIDRVVPTAVDHGLKDFSAERGVPIKNAHLALHVRALGRLLGLRRVVTGVVANGRPEVPGGADMVGLFLNTLPFPVDLEHTELPDLVAQVFEIEQAAAAHRRYPLAEIQRVTGERAWFDTLFNYTDFHINLDTEGGAVSIKGARYFEHTNFPMVVHVHRDHFSGTLRLIVHYDTAAVAARTVERYLDDYLSAAGELITRHGHDRPGATLEQRIRDIVATAIAVDDLGIDDNYLELGVDSITAIRVVVRVKKLNPAVTMQDVFACRTVRQLAIRVDTPSDAPRPGPHRLRQFQLTDARDHPFPPEVVDAYPATEMQLAMIRAFDRDTTQAAYHDVFSYRLAAPLDEALLRASLSRIMHAHDIFRTGFALNGYSTPMQCVYGQVDPQLRIVDLAALSDLDQQRSFDAWFEHEKQATFEWEEPGLIRFFAHQRSATSFDLTVSFPHALIDGWSLSLFLRDLVQGYLAALRGAAAPAPPGPGPAYREYVRIELESRNSLESQDFWRQMLDGYTLSPLPRSGAHSPAVRWHERKVVVSAGRRATLAKLAVALGIPLKYLALAAHLRVSSLICRHADLVTGVFTSTRPEQDGAENMLGLFLNFVPLRLHVDRQTWRELITETFDTDNRSLRHRRYPLPCIERDIGGPLFETLFNYTRFEAYRDLDGVVEDVRWFEHTAVPLLVNVGHDLRQERLIITLNADARVLSGQAVELIAALYDATLTELVTQPDEPVTTLSAETAALVAALIKP